MKRLLAAFVRNRVFADIVLVTIFLAGAIAASRMVRETFPQFSDDRIAVSVVYPGADPEEVEEGISRKIEEVIEDVEGIKEYGTLSREGLATADIVVQDGHDVSEVLDRVRTRVDAISNLPVDAERPIVEEVLIKDPVLMLSLSADMPEQRLKEWAESVKEELQQLPEVSQVAIYGTRAYEIGIEVSEARLRQYGLSFSEVVDAVRRSSVTLSGGTLRTQDAEIRIRTVGRKYTGAELARVVVLARPGGDLVTLDHVATIVDGFEETPIEAQVNGKRAVFLSIMKTSEEDALEIAGAVMAYKDQKNASLPEGVRIGTIYDWSEMLNARIRLLVKNGIIGLSFVFLLLWLFLDLRLSFWAGLGMPVSVAGALVILWMVGGTINMISLFGLIMVLGIIVDDAIVVGESIYVHAGRGEPPVRAAVEGLSEVGLAVVAAVLTTIVAFLPLLAVGGIMGKFIAILPVVVISCLSVSLLECLLLLPAHLGNLEGLATGKHQPASRNPLRRFARAMHRVTGGALERFVNGPYAAFLSRAVRWRYVALSTAVAVLLVTVGLMKSGILKFELFPAFDGFVMTATVEFPDGTPSHVTQQALAELEYSLQRVSARHTSRTGEPIVESRIVLVGQSIGMGGGVGAHIGSVQAILLDSEKRGVPSKSLLAAWRRETGVIPGVEALRFEEMEAGPPGAPIEIWLQGQDIETVTAAAESLMTKLEHFEGVYQIQSDHRPGRDEIRLALKPEARTLGLTVGDLATQVNAGYFGTEAVRLQRGRDDIRVRVRYPLAERRRFADFARIRIRTPDGRAIPLHAVADMTFGPGYTAISRKNGMRNVSVSADVDTAIANTQEIVATIESDYLPQLRADHPGLYVSVQGEKKRFGESLSSLKIGFPLAIVGIYVVVATLFRSYVQPLIILVTVPFGLIGAAIGHLIMGLDLSIMSMFGAVALAGVVVNDAIVMIDCINANQAAGMGVVEAIREAGTRRFRPVLLTTLTTIGGLMPLILESDLQALFLIPMALSLAAGVGFATVVTLLLIPCLMAILNDMRRLVHRWRFGRWSTPEGVEPRSPQYWRAGILDGRAPEREGERT